MCKKEMYNIDGEMLAHKIRQSGMRRTDLSRLIDCKPGYVTRAINDGRIAADAYYRLIKRLHCKDGTFISEQAKPYVQPHEKKSDSNISDQDPCTGLNIDVFSVESAEKPSPGFRARKTKDGVITQFERRFSFNGRQYSVYGHTEAECREKESAKKEQLEKQLESTSLLEKRLAYLEAQLSYHELKAEYLQQAIATTKSKMIPQEV